jgi:quercetin dioxygenase-like cupin family protein
MHLSRTILWTSLVVAGLAFQAPAVVGGQEPAGFVRTQPENMKFVPVEGGLGAQQAILEGDPAKAGLYVIRMKFPPGVMSRPHTHSQDRLAVVLKGTWWTGTGPDFKPETTVPVKTGGFMKHPKDGVHYDGAKDEEVIVQITGMGPVSSPRIRPADGGYGRSITK